MSVCVCACANMCVCEGQNLSYLAYHPIPDASDELPMFTIGDQVKIIGELDGARELLENVDAEALTAQFSVRL